MARISKSDTAPQDAEHFSLGAVEFDLDDKNTVYETDDAAVIANARANPDLKVEVDPVAADVAAAPVDPLDPHVNPAADHLSAFASPEAISAADANEQAIKDATGGDVTAPTDAPTVAETLDATFSAAGVQDATPELPPVPNDTPADAPTASTPSAPSPATPATPATPAAPDHPTPDAPGKPNGSPSTPAGGNS